MTLGRIGRNTAWVFLGRVLSQGLLVLVTILLARRLGLAGLGGYAFVATLVFLANVATTFGTDMVLIREIASGVSPDRWGAALLVQLALSAVAIGGVWVAAPLIPGQGPEVVEALRICILSLGPAALFNVSTAALRGAGRMGRLALVGVTAALLQLGAIWILVSPGAGLPWVATVLLGVQVAAGVVAWATCAVSVAGFPVAPRVATTDLVDMARVSAPIGVLGLLGVAYQRAGVIALAMFVGPAATGWFTVASRVVEASKLGHASLFVAIYPAMAEAHGSAGPGPAPERALAWSERLSALGAVVLAAGVLALSPIVVGLLFGPAFAPAAGAAGVLALSIVPSTLATYQSLVLLAVRREDLTLRVLLLSLLVLLALLVTLIPVMGWIGACWAVLGAETVQGVGLLVARRRLSARSGVVYPAAPSGRTVDVLR